MEVKIKKRLNFGVYKRTTFFFLCLKGRVVMKNIIILKLIEKFRLGEMEAFTAVYNTFKDLIRFYSCKIGDEDSLQELNVYFLELLYSLDTDRFIPDCSDSIHRYIAVSLRNKYIALSKENQSYTQMLNFLDENKVFCSNTADGVYFIKESLNFLPIRQRTVIMYRYVYGYSDNEIAQMLNISRQAVSKLRNRALTTLRNLYV